MHEPPLKLHYCAVELEHLFALQYTWLTSSYVTYDQASGILYKSLIEKSKPQWMRNLYQFFFWAKNSANQSIF